MRDTWVAPKRPPSSCQCVHVSPCIRPRIKPWIVPSNLCTCIPGPSLICILSTSAPGTTPGTTPGSAPRYHTVCGAPQIQHCLRLGLTLVQDAVFRGNTRTDRPNTEIIPGRKRSTDGPRFVNGAEKSRCFGTQHCRQTKLGNASRVTVGAGSVRVLNEGVSTLSDARSRFALTSKIPPLGSMLNFDANVKKTSARHPM